MPRVFLSYARVDGELRTNEIRQRLAREASDIVVQQDRLLLEGGIGWWKQITDSIDSVDFLILVMTPAAITSGNVQKEWRYARQQGVCVYPVKAATDAELQFAQMPRWMSKAHFFDLEREWPTFIAHLRKGCDTPRVPFMAPDLPPYFVDRPREYEALKDLLLTPERSQPVAITTALTGAGGFGKTTLAAALCHDEDILENFDDGILWVTLGQTPDVLGALLTIYAALTGQRPGFAGAEDAAFQLAQRLEQRTCLLVIDDVWDAAHLRPFLRAGKTSAHLFTTRDANLASDSVAVIVDEMREAEAVAMLAKGVPSLEIGPARDLARRLGEWPLALELALAMMRERVREGEPARQVATRLLTIIERKGVRALQDPAAGRRHRTVTSVLEVSLELLDAADRRRLAELSVFPEDVAIPLGAAASVWELDEWDAEDLARRLAGLSLLKLDLERGVLQLHDVMRSWLAADSSGTREIHNRILNAWPDWENLPELPGDYAWRWLPWHLVQADRQQDAERILWDPKWMQAKLKATDINALIADYGHVQPSPELELIQGALRLSSHVLAADAEQFAAQMVGRLLPHQGTPAIRQFTDTVVAAAPKCWLRPLHPALHPPGTELVRTLEGHSGFVDGVAITPDGKRAVSASWDKTLKVWDLDTGLMLHTLQGHSAHVYGVAVTPDGARAVSASWDHTLKVWDLETGAELRTLEGHSDSVSAVAVMPDGKRAISGSGDHTLKLWDLQSGRALATLEGHTQSVFAVAVTPDGRRAISASGDKTLKLWDLDTGRVLHSLEGHAAGVYGVAVTPNGKRAVSASYDHTLTLWDLVTGRAVHKLEGHTDSVTGVAVTPDGRRAVSSSWDHTLKVWDLDTGGALRTLAGHSAGVYGVAVTPNGERAVSASVENTLKVWDLGAGTALRTPEGHFDAIRAVAVAPDGRHAVSASVDSMLKLWDLATGRVLCTMTGHSAGVYGVAVTPDGKRAVSASGDHTLKVWDAATGETLHTLEGHTSAVYGVAVTPDGRLAVSASGDQALKVWDLSTGEVLHTLEGHSNFVSGVAISPDGKLAVSTSGDHTLKVWDLYTGGLLRTMKGHTQSVYAIAITPDGLRAISAAGDHTLRVWDLLSGAWLCTLKGHSGSLAGVAVTPDGKRVVSASRDHTLMVWDIESGESLAAFHCDASPRCCTVAGGQTILAGDSGGRLHFLEFETPRGATASGGQTILAGDSGGRLHFLESETPRWSNRLRDALSNLTASVRPQSEPRP